MEKIREKYAFVIGVVTLLILLSNFTEILAEINIDLGFIAFNLKQYYLGIVGGISLCFYLYIIESIFRESKIGNWTLFEYIVRFAYYLFGFILLSPLLILLSWLAYQLFDLIGEERMRDINKVLNFIIILLTLIYSVISTNRYLKIRKKLLQESMEEEEIRELDNASKLYRDGYYSQSILESFKVLEIHLFRLLSDRGVRVRRHKIQELIDKAFQQEIINYNDKEQINKIRKMRNSAAHLNVEHNQEQAELALKYSRELINKTAPDNE